MQTWSPPPKLSGRTSLRVMSSRSGSANRSEIAVCGAHQRDHRIAGANGRGGSSTSSVANREAARPARTIRSAGVPRRRHPRARQGSEVKSHCHDGEARSRRRCRGSASWSQTSDVEQAAFARPPPESRSGFHGDHRSAEEVIARVASPLLDEVTEEAVQLSMALSAARRTPHRPAARTSDRQRQPSR